MTGTASSTRKSILNIADEARGNDLGFAAFLTRMTNSLDVDDLEGWKAEDFVTVCRNSYGLLIKDKPGSPSVHIHPAEPRPEIEVIDVFNDDMPFLVDSTLGAVRGLGGTVRLVGHPILPIKATKDGLEVLTEKTPDCEKLSHLHMHIDAFPDPASTEALREELEEVMAQVRATVRGWRGMLERLAEVIRSYRDNPPPIDPTSIEEAIGFLGWLGDHNFTFIGMREYRLAGTGENQTLEPVPDSGLGVLEDPDFKYLRQGDEYVEMTDQHLAYLKSPDALLVTKANIRSKVHRRVHYDYVGIKLYDEAGKPNGELRVLGLFTSMSLSTPHTEVPLVRRKVAEVMRRSGYEPGSHSGKGLMNALDHYPRDELFQISTDDLFEFATAIASLVDRPRVRVFPRIDPFDNFVSILVFLPRDRFDSNLRSRIGTYLAEAYDGRVSAFYPSFPEGDLVRVHFIIGRNGGVTPRPERDELEDAVADLTRSFGDRMMSAAENRAAIAPYREAFSEAYQEAFTHHDALGDIAAFDKLKDAGDIGLKLHRHRSDPDALSLKIYHLKSPIPLSARVPMLENFGFRVINERSYGIRPVDGIERILHDMTVEPADGRIDNLEALAGTIETALNAVWHGDAENDGFNQLTLKAGLAWDDVSIVRALGRYLKQVGIAYSQRYLWTSLATHPEIGKALIDLFYARLDPGFEDERRAAEIAARDVIANALDAITSIDDDRIVRRFLNLVDCALRTNFFQRPEGGRRPALAIKFDAPRVEAMPEPRPYREIFVYSPRVEGIHLRGGAIARGGLRWSDRPEDFRTEILGLVKAQMVKNAVIVPVGAKGGFYPKQMPASPSREDFIAEGTACYKIFIGSLLDITDNLDGDTVIPPKSVVRLDGDDPYLVVAADKGTATFSDTANAISDERGFWLSDAFASGGSAGYDHKKMGITARGGWEAVKRHFREMDRDIQTTPFTAAGVGDMSGDVFGNGMLLSTKTRLVAAFDHRDIFIDPDPDTDVSYAERKRLFEMGRSSWQDYDTSKLSKGGGIHPRNAKSIDLSPEGRALLGLSDGKLTPTDVMVAILRADVDLLWFGGIGTYIAAKGESDAEVGDRANDAIRIRGHQVRAKVIGEGANLGVTQLGRIEYARLGCNGEGGRVNSDAIDNSAGVNSSDLEVNIKIALGTLVRAGQMTIEQRNTFLASMTDEVAELCLRNNYLQTLAISLAERHGAADTPFHAALIRSLEAEGELNRAVEFLPDDATLATREESGEGLTRPEIAVLLAYAKNTLYADLLNSEVPDDPYLGKELFRYFPDTLAEKYPETIETHRLRREVIATVLCNAMINRGGPSFIHQLVSSTGAKPAQIASAYAVARDAFGLTDLNAEIDELDNKVEGDTQLALYDEVRSLLLAQTVWFLRNESLEGGVSDLVERYREGVDVVAGLLDELVPRFVADALARQAQQFEAGGTPADLAGRLAHLSALTLASDIIAIAQRADMPVADAARAYFAVFDIFNLGRITELGDTVAVSDYYDRMALGRATANMMRAQRDLTLDVLATGADSVEAALKTWQDGRSDEITRTRDMVASITEGTITVSRLSVAAGLLSDLARG
ncbi:NAD-glutamate dehydrogenase [Cucumibacter marinus]|uniref:NAD-glutamate dehydrogenase n=1 Tax=Cucumibacter marinus TaxID=1121252 RepID=UPI000400D292|nr:NAD-glutamate dehydrogenase [Cucumibacter marinus]